MKKKISVTIDEKILKGIDNFIDGLIIRNRSQAIESIVNKILETKRTAVIFANGLHFRVTNDYFRVLGELKKNETVIEFIIRKLRSYNFRDIYMIGDKDLLSQIFKILNTGSRFGVDIKYLHENGVEGSQDRLRLLKGIVKTSFLLVPAENVFDIDLREFMRFHLSNRGIASLAVVSWPHKMIFAPTKLGNVVMDGNRIVKFVQKPKIAISHLLSTGIMIAEPEIFEYQGEWLEYDVFPKLTDMGMLFGYPSSSYWFDIHTQKDLKTARKFLRNKKDSFYK